MQLFIRIVDAGGISRAADQLGLAKSAVSRRLSALEESLGVPLILRTTRRSSVTEAGRSYYEQVRRIINDIADLNSLTANAAAALTGTLKIAVPLSFGLLHLAPAIDAFLEQHPDLSVDIDFSDRRIDLIEEGFDLALRIAELKDSSLIARKISPIRFVLCASPGYLERCGIPETPEALHSHRLLHYNLATTTSWRLRGRNGQLHSIKVDAKIKANNGDFLKDMAVAGHGILLSPTFISWQAIASGALVPVLEDYQLPQLNAYAVYPQTRFLSQRVRLLIDFLIRRFGANPYWDQTIST